jgi:hypothetical protein
LSQLCQEKGIEASEVIAFGDGFNDVGMLQWVGHPVIMENANPKLKQQVANANIAKSNAEEGVADYLLNHVLKNS